MPIDQPDITVNAIWTMGDERTNEVFLNDVFVPDDYVVGELNQGFQYISEALDLERFTMFTFSPIAQRLDLLVEYVRTTARDGVPLKDDPVIRQRLAQLATQLEVARVMGLKFVFESSKGGAAPTAEASEYKLFATELSKRLANASMDIAGPGAPAPGQDEEAPMAGRSESTYRYTVIDTIGGGRLGDPEEHHRPPQARPAEELLRWPPNRLPRTVPSDGVTVLDLSTVGPAARCTRLLADYGAPVVKVGPVPSADAAPIEPAVLRLQRAPWHAPRAGRSEGRRRAGGLPGPGGGGRRGGRELPARRGRPAGHRVRRRVGAQPRHRLLLDHRLRPGRPARRSGPATTSTTWRSAATWP